MKRDGPSTDPCAIPESTSTCDEFTPSTTTVVTSGEPNFDPAVYLTPDAILVYLVDERLWLTLSKALAKSMMSTSV